MNFLCVCGSLRSNSWNAAILGAISALVPKDITTKNAAPLDRLPHFNPDLDNENPPPAVRDWRREIQSADAVIFASPEYAHGVPGVLKNALDWIVSSGELVHKPVSLINASPNQFGAVKAQASLTQTLTVMDANLLPATILSVPHVYSLFDSEKKLMNLEVSQALQAIVEKLTSMLSDTSSET